MTHDSGEDDDIIAMLRQSIERYAAEHYTFEQRWVALNDPLGHSSQAWSDYGRLGWLALRLPTDAGGMDAGPAVIAPLMETVGARLLLEPLLASAVVCTALLLRRGTGEQRVDMIPKLANGSLRLAFAHQESLSASTEDTIRCRYEHGTLHGAKVAVLHGDCADRFIVSAENRDQGGAISLYLISASSSGVRRECFRMLDGRGAANVVFAAAAAEPLDAASRDEHANEHAITATLNEAAVALCSEALGAIRALNAATNQYLKTRKQFGRAIGTNQALQHRMVDMWILEQEVRALTLAAQSALPAFNTVRSKVISGARAFVCSAARRVAAEAVQMHGGMGVSDELDISHYYRRLMVLGTLFGNRDYHFKRFAATCD